MGMEGPGPGNGFPVRMGILAGSSNPVALDIIASQIAGYEYLDIPTTRTALQRGLWLKSAEEIEYSGPELSSLIKDGFIKVGIKKNGNVAVQFVVRRIKPLRKLEKRPVFYRKIVSDVENVLPFVR